MIKISDMSVAEAMTRGEIRKLAEKESMMDVVNDLLNCANFNTKVDLRAIKRLAASNHHRGYTYYDDGRHGAITMFLVSKDRQMHIMRFAVNKGKALLTSTVRLTFHALARWVLREQNTDLRAMTKEIHEDPTFFMHMGVISRHLREEAKICCGNGFFVVDADKEMEEAEIRHGMVIKTYVSMKDVFPAQQQELLRFTGIIRDVACIRGCTETEAMEYILRKRYNWADKQPERFQALLAERMNDVAAVSQEMLDHYYTVTE